MKILLISALGMLAFAGCDSLRAVDCPIRLEQGDDPPSGEISALRNDEPWPMSSLSRPFYARSNDEMETMSIDVGVDLITERGWDGEHLFFAGIPKRVGSYRLPRKVEETMKEQTLFFYTDEGGDALGDVYRLYKSDKQVVTITSYNPSTCMIEGTFALTVVRDTTGGRKVHLLPDTLRFAQGRFRTHVVTYP